MCQGRTEWGYWRPPSFPSGSGPDSIGGVDALLTSFLAAGLGEFGDRTQLFAALLAARFGRPGLILAGLGLGALINMTLAGLAGAFVNDFIMLDTTTLVVAVALLYAGATGFVARRIPAGVESAGTRPFWAALAGGFVLEFADKSQFLTFAMAARTDSASLTALGATAGILAAAVPALALGPRLGEVLPLKAIRVGAALLFLLAAFIVAVNALGLV